MADNNFNSSKFNPSGNVGAISITVTAVPLVGAAELLLTVRLYTAPICPWVKFPVWLLLIDRTGTAAGLIVVGLLAVTVPAVPPPETLAWLVTEDGAVAATFTVAVMDG